MCNLKEKTDLKTVVIYKAVEKHKGNYYSYFALTKIKLGTVEPQTLIISGGLLFTETQVGYNKNMVGKCSGFENESNAQTLADCADNAVLKIVLGGEIWIGDSTNIDSNIPEDSVIYAGSEIQSFEEI